MTADRHSLQERGCTVQKLLYASYSLGGTLAESLLLYHTYTHSCSFQEHPLYGQAQHRTVNTVVS
jgi:hypothetical protein